MMTRQWHSLLTAASIGAFLLMSSPVSAQSQSLEAHESSRSSLEGTWLFTLTRINQGFSFIAVQSFTAGGVTLATGSIQPPVAPLLGSWQQVMDHQFAATIYFYLFDPSGTATNLIKTNLLLRLEGRNTVLGSGEGFSCDLQGENCVRVPEVDIQIKGRRIIPEKVQP
jgi:hypothetical protein